VIKRHKRQQSCQSQASLDSGYSASLEFGITYEIEHLQTLLGSLKTAGYEVQIARAANKI